MSVLADGMSAASRPAAEGRERVSVVIPTYNRARLVCRAIDSALNQSHRDVEVIVIDDGSVDGTEAAIAGHYARESRLRYIRQSNGGVSNARNHGLAEARGDFIAFLDSDDLWLPWKLELQLAALRELPEVGMVWSDMAAVDEHGRVLSERYLRSMYSAYAWFPGDSLFERSRFLPTDSLAGEAVPRVVRQHWGEIYSQMIMGNLVHTSTVLLRRATQLQVGGFDESLAMSGEDYDFHMRTCRVGPVSLLDLATVLYTVGAADQLTRPGLEVHIAANALTVVQAALATDRGRIRLPAARLRARLARLHCWLGEELVGAGRAREARRPFLRSLHAKPWQPRTWLLMLTTCLPGSWMAPLRRLASPLRRIGYPLRRLASRWGG